MEKKRREKKKQKKMIYSFVFSKGKERNRKIFFLRVLKQERKKMKYVVFTNIPFKI